MKIAGGAIRIGAPLTFLLLMAGLTGCSAGASNQPVSGIFARQTMPNGSKDISSAELVFTKVSNKWKVTGVSGVATSGANGNVQASSSDIKGDLSEDLTHFVSTNSDGCTFEAHFTGNALTVDNQDAFCGKNTSYEGTYAIAANSNSTLQANPDAEAAKVNATEIASETGNSVGLDPNVTVDTSYSSPIAGEWRTNPNEMTGVVLIALRTASGREEAQVDALEDSGMGVITGDLNTVLLNHYKVVDYNFPSCSIEFQLKNNSITIDHESVSTDCANRGVSFEGSMVKDVDSSATYSETANSNSSPDQGANTAQASADEAQAAVAAALQKEAATTGSGDSGRHLLTGTWSIKDAPGNDVTITTQGSSYIADISAVSTNGDIGELKGIIQRQSDDSYVIKSDDGSCSANLHFTDAHTVVISGDNGACDGASASLNGTYVSRGSNVSPVSEKSASSNNVDSAQAAVDTAQKAALTTLSAELGGASAKSVVNADNAAAQAAATLASQCPNATSRCENAIHVTSLTLGDSIESDGTIATPKANFADADGTIIYADVGVTTELPFNAPLYVRWWKQSDGGRWLAVHEQSQPIQGFAGSAVYHLKIQERGTDDKSGHYRLTISMNGDNLAQQDFVIGAPLPRTRSRGYGMMRNSSPTARPYPPLLERH